MQSSPLSSCGVTPAALLVSRKLRFQRPPQASGLQDFPGSSAQMTSLGESPGATRRSAVPRGGEATRGTIARVCDADSLPAILRTGQWVPPRTGPPNNPGTRGHSGCRPGRYPKVPGGPAQSYQAFPLNNWPTRKARAGPAEPGVNFSTCHTAGRLGIM